MAHAAMDRLSRLAGSVVAHQGRRRALGHRPHGTCGCQGRARVSRIRVHDKAIGRGEDMGEAVGCLPQLGYLAGLSRGASIPRIPRPGEPGTVRLGHRLAPSVLASKDAERRRVAGSLQRLDARRDRSSPYSRRKPGQALWIRIPAMSPPATPAGWRPTWPRWLQAGGCRKGKVARKRARGRGGKRHRQFAYQGLK